MLLDLQKFIRESSILMHPNAFTVDLQLQLFEHCTNLLHSVIRILNDMLRALRFHEQLMFLATHGEHDKCSYTALTQTFLVPLRKHSFRSGAEPKPCITAYTQKIEIQQ